MRCESIHISVDDRQLGIQDTAEVQRELCDQLIAFSIGKPPWSTKEFLCAVREIEHYDVVSPEIFADEFRDKRPQEWTKQTLKTFDEAMEWYMVEVIPGSHFGSSN
jgi:hypothetical protein